MNRILLSSAVVAAVTYSSRFYTVCKVNSPEEKKRSVSTAGQAAKWTIDKRIQMLKF